MQNLVVLLILFCASISALGETLCDGVVSQARVLERFRAQALAEPKLDMRPVIEYAEKELQQRRFSCESEKRDEEANARKLQWKGTSICFRYNEDLLWRAAYESRTEHGDIERSVYENGQKHMYRISALKAGCEQSQLPGVRIGMTGKQVRQKTSWGEPVDVHTTTTKYGKREQWVYEAGYLYFENGILISIQN